MKENGGRRPRFRRVTDFSNIRLTDRDKAILSIVRQYGFVTTGHILSLVPGSRQNVTRRLQRLYHAGFLDRPKAQLPLRYSGEIAEFVYGPTNKAVSTEGSSGSGTASRREYRPPSSLFLAHAIAVSDVLIFFASSFRQLGAPFLIEPDILGSGDRHIRRLQWRVTLRCDSNMERVGVVPDGVFAVERIDRSGTLRLFYYLIEVDRGTMPVYRKRLRFSSIYRKALAYLKSRKSGILKDRFNIPGFQVLFVTHSEERLERMREACESASSGFSSLFLFATVNDLRNSDDAFEILKTPPNPNKPPSST